MHRWITSIFQGCALIGLMLGLVGCARLGVVEGSTLPVRLDKHTMKNDAERQAYHQRLFPLQPQFEVASCAVDASGRFGIGEVPTFRANYIQDAAGRVRLRCSAPQQAAPFLDLIVNEDQLTVMEPLARVAFRAPMPEDESTPFGRTFGVEPCDLKSIFVIGQTLGSEPFVFKRGLLGSRLKPEQAAGGLRWVKLNKTTGLPTEAKWVRGDLKYDVAYHHWLETGPGAGGERLLMPGLLTIEGGGIRLMLTMDEHAEYRFDRKLPARMFQAAYLNRYMVYSLDQMEEVLSKR